MIDPRGIYIACLEQLLTLSAVVNGAATGSSIQVGLLRAMGVNVKGPVSFLTKASFVRPENLRLGRYMRVGRNARMVCWGEVTIGDDFLCSDRLVINSGTHDPETAKPILAPVHIGDRVWCGANVTICAGVTIGDDVVIGAGAVVVKDIPSGCVAAGVPCKPVRELRRTADTPLWSSWPERSAGSRYQESGKFRQLLYRLRTHL